MYKYLKSSIIKIPLLKIRKRIYLETKNAFIRIILLNTLQVFKV